MRKFNAYIMLFAVMLYFSMCAEKRGEAKYEVSTKIEPEDKIDTLDSYVDSLHIGKQGETKVELLKYQNLAATQKCFIIVSLFEKENGQWKLTFKDSVQSEPLAKLQAESDDYNSDGLGDLRFCSDMGANLANQMYAMFIYSPASKSLKLLGVCWNIEYSKKLKMFRERYAASTLWAHFYELHEDILQIKFKVDLGATAETVIEYTDKGGILKEYKTVLNEKTGKLPPVKHWIRAWAVKDSLN